VGANIEMSQSGETALSTSNLLIILIVEVLIIGFCIYRAKGKFGINDIQKPDGGAGTFNFWFFFLNFILLAVTLENIFFAILSLALWIIRLKLKSVPVDISSDDSIEKNSVNVQSNDSKDARRETSKVRYTEALKTSVPTDISSDDSTKKSSITIKSNEPKDSRRETFKARYTEAQKNLDKPEQRKPFSKAIVCHVCRHALIVDSLERETSCPNCRQHLVIH
jgi:hypothetical protein